MKTILEENIEGRQASNRWRVIQVGHFVQLKHPWTIENYKEYIKYTTTLAIIYTYTRGSSSELQQFFSGEGRLDYRFSAGEGD